MQEINQKIKEDLERLTLLFKTEKYGILGDPEGKVKRCGIEFLAMFESYLTNPVEQVKAQTATRPNRLIIELKEGDRAYDVVRVKDGMHGHFRYAYSPEDKTYYIFELAYDTGVFYEEAEKFPFFKYE